MNGFFALAAGLLISAALIFSGPARAMEIRQFDKMASEDKGEFVGALVGAALRVFNDEARPDLAEKVNHLFTTTLSGDKITIGVGEFQLNLARARLADSDRVAKDANAHRLEVEDAMLVTLKKNNIPLSEDFIRAFRAIGKNFRPKFPLEQ